MSTASTTVEALRRYYLDEMIGGPLFRLNRWTERQLFVEHPSAAAETVPQDAEQRWFPGVHADIGGGYPEAESALSKAPLLWMAEEARDRGLLINERLLDRVGRGLHQEESRRLYVAPDPAGRLHRPLSGAWWLLEWLPRSARRREPGRGIGGIYLPLGERRVLPPNATLDGSVAARMASLPDYRPPNLPAPQGPIEGGAPEDKGGQV